MKSINGFFLGVLYLCVFTSCSSCSSNTTHGDSSEYNKYVKTLKLFSEPMVSHFPKTASFFKFRNTEYVDTSSYHNTLEFSLTVYNDQAVIDSVLKLNQSPVFGTDTCVLLVNDFLNEKNYGDPFRAKKSTFNEKCKEQFIIPNFWSSDFYTDSTKSKLPKDFVFYILKSEKGIFSNKIRIEQSSMPENVKHGYSKGYAISKERQVIIYWIIVW